MNKKRAILKNTILEYIGNTPMVCLKNISSGLNKNIKIFVKLEGSNPGGSVKDRPALQMILDGLDSGELTKDKIILDSTSGNTGVALALIGSVLGYSVKLCMPENVSEERKQTIVAYGADIVYTDPMEGSDGAIIECKDMYDKDPQKYFKPDQYGNESNPKAHTLTTAAEIWQQTSGQVTHFLATIGTSGTIMGVTRGLKKFNENINCIAIEPDNPFHGLEGLKHMESSIVPKIYKPHILDEIINIETEASYEMCIRLAREEGLFVGQSSGAAILATLNYAKNLDSATMVTIACDNGSRYYSKGLWK